MIFFATFRDPWATYLKMSVAKEGKVLEQKKTTSASPGNPWGNLQGLYYFFFHKYTFGVPPYCTTCASGNIFCSKAGVKDVLWGLAIKRKTGKSLVSFVFCLVDSGSGGDLWMLLNSSNLPILPVNSSKVWVCGSKWQQQCTGGIQEIHLRTFEKRSSPDSFYIYSSNILRS